MIYVHNIEAIRFNLIRRYCEVSAIAVTLMACLVLYGWVFHIGGMVAVLPGLVSMKANTALGLVLSAASLWLLLLKRQTLQKTRTAGFLGLVVMLLGAATLVEYLLGLHLGIDELMFTDTMTSVGTSSPGRMAPMTATAFLAIGLALMLLLSQSRAAHRLSQILSLGAGLTAMMAISGYVYQATAVSKILLYTQMAIHTAAGLLLLSVAIFFVRPHTGIAGDLTGVGPGSVTARRFLPAIFFIPLLLGWLCMKGQSAGMYGAELHLSLFATANIAVFAVLIWLSALKLNAEYGQRSGAESEIRALNADLERRVEERSRVSEQQWRIFNMTLSSIVDFAYTFDRDGRFLYVNQSLLDLWGLRLEDALGKNFFELPYPYEMAERLQGQVEQVFATGQKLVDVTEYTNPEGVVGYFEYFFCPILGIDNTVELVSGATLDITRRKAAEEHLVHMESRYRGLLEAAPDAMVVVNQGGEIVLLNVQAEKQFGYHRDELIGQKVKNLIPEGFAERLIADGTRTAAEALAQQIGTGIELIGERKDGSEFPIEIMLSPLESEEGTLVTVAIRNITTRKDLEKRVEDRTKAIELQWRNFNTTIASIVDHAFMFDPQGRFLYANQALLDLLERTLEEVVGKTCFELPYTPELATRIQSQIQQVVSTRQKVVDGTHYVSPSGANAYTEYFLSPMIDGEGEVQFIAGGGFDVTKRKLAEVHLEQMEARYRGLLEAAPDGMVVVNQRGEIVLLNARAEKQFRYWRDELIGQKVKRIIPQGFAERLIADGSRTAAEALAQQIGTGIELTGLRKDGSEFPIEIMLSPLQSVEGILVTAAIRDISVRRAADERYRGLLEAAPDAMVVVNQSGEIVLLNVQAEKQFGYHRDELIGQKVKNLIPEGFAERLIADGTRTAAEALAQQIGTGIELIGRRKDGSEFPIEIMLSPLESFEGILVTAAIRDISVRKAAKQHLMQTEEKYRGLLEAAPDAMVVVNQGGEIVLVNVQAEKRFGYHRDELIGQKMKNLIPEGFAERLIADALRSTEDALAQQIGTGIELLGRRKDGSEFPIEILLSPLQSVEGILVTAAIRDISVRQAAKQHLVQTEVKYRGLLEAAPDAMVVVNQDGEIVLLNVQAEKQFGYHRDELIGQKVKNLIPEGFAERLIADGTRTAAEALAQQIGTGIELIGRRKDGSEFPIEIMLSPLDSVDGILVTAAIRDISVRKAAKQHLTQAEAQYRGLLEAAPDAMVVVNEHGEIVLLNVQAEKQFRYHRDELIGQQVKNLIPEGFAERLIADALRSTEDALAQQIGTGIELIGRRKDGSEFPIEIMLSPLQSVEGTVVTAAIRDISTRKEAEAQLQRKVEELSRSNEELEQFAYIASHDLQEPLRMVASYTQLLSRRYKGKLDSDADEFIFFAVDGASRMQRLIQDLLAYSRVGTQGKRLLNISSETALEQALFNLRGAIKDCGALVTHDPLPPVMADEIQLTQLFQNLVGNALKYQNREVPAIHISVRKNGRSTWKFAVRDNGIGIDSKYFERIFGMFQRLHKREEFAGTGIGLAICKKIAERHGGTISVESEPGLGSTFYFCLRAGEVQP